MGRDISDDVLTVMRSFDLSKQELADILGASRQSIYRWLEGGPAEGLNEILLHGVGEALRRADEFVVAGWRNTVKGAYAAHGPSLEVLRAFVTPAPSFEKVASAWETLASAPQFTVKLAPSSRKSAAVLERHQFSIRRTHAAPKNRPKTGPDRNR